MTKAANSAVLEMSEKAGTPPSTACDVVQSLFFESPSPVSSLSSPVRSQLSRHTLHSDVVQQMSTHLKTSIRLASDFLSAMSTDSDTSGTDCSPKRPAPAGVFTVFLGVFKFTSGTSTLLVCSQCSDGVFQVTSGTLASSRSPVHQWLCRCFHSAKVCSQCS